MLLLRLEHDDKKNLLAKSELGSLQRGRRNLSSVQDNSHVREGGQEA